RGLIERHFASVHGEMARHDTLQEVRIDGGHRHLEIHGFLTDVDLCAPIAQRLSAKLIASMQTDASGAATGIARPVQSRQNQVKMNASGTLADIASRYRAKPGRAKGCRNVKTPCRA